MRKAYEFLNEVVKEEYVDGDNLGSVSINDAYWACKIAATEALSSTLQLHKSSFEEFANSITSQISKIQNSKLKEI